MCRHVNEKLLDCYSFEWAADNATLIHFPHPGGAAWVRPLMILKMLIQVVALCKRPRAFWTFELSRKMCLSNVLQVVLFLGSLVWRTQSANSGIYAVNDEVRDKCLQVGGFMVAFGEKATKSAVDFDQVKTLEFFAQCLTSLVG